MIYLFAGAATLAMAVPSDAELKVQIEARDTELFDVYFNKCQPDQLRKMVTPDVEFYHDKGGVVAHDANALVADYEKSCREKLSPDAWRSRRELVSPSLRVYPIPGFGAIEEGDHRFYERKGDGPEKLVGAAHFVIVWSMQTDGWRMSRVLSYGHVPIE